MPHGPNTYADPGVVLLGAPATMVEELIAADTPRLSFAAPSEAVSSVAVLEFFQPLDGFAKTYAAP